MMKRRGHILLVMAVLIGTAGSAAQAVWNVAFVKRAHPYMVATRGPSPYAGVRKQMSAAQSDLTRAYAAAAKTDAFAEEIRTAQTELAAARQAYATALASARAEMDKSPLIAGQREVVKKLEARKAAASGDEMLRLAHELVTARQELKTAEGDLLDIDADLAVSKATMNEAAEKFKDAQARRQMAVSQDPAVVAARERLAGLRQQMAVRR